MLPPLSGRRSPEESFFHAFKYSIVHPPTRNLDIVGDLRPYSSLSQGLGIENEPLISVQDKHP